MRVGSGFTREEALEFNSQLKLGKTKRAENAEHFPPVRQIRYVSGFFSHQLLQFLLVPRKLANTLGQLLGAHGIFVHCPAELAFIQLLLGLAGIAWLEHARQFTLVIAQLLQQFS